MDEILDRVSTKYNAHTAHKRVVASIGHRVISERPTEVEDRAVLGHWEDDLIAGSGNTHIAILVERDSRFTMLIKVNGKDTQTVVAALTRQVKALPQEYRCR